MIGGGLGDGVMESRGLWESAETRPDVPLLEAQFIHSNLKETAEKDSEPPETQRDGHKVGLPSRGLTSQIEKLLHVFL